MQVTATKTKEKKMSQAALKAFFNICEDWGLSSNEEIILLGVSKSSYYNWKKDPESAGKLPKDTLERISYILGIYKGLRVSFAKKETSLKWIKLKNNNPYFGGKSALSRMLGGYVGDLYAVRSFVDAMRGAW